MDVWNEIQKTIQKYVVYGDVLTGTLDNAAVVDNGDGTVDITITGHGLVANTWIKITGTTNYDGAHKVESAPDVNSIYITATFVAETPAGTETYEVYYDMANVEKIPVKAWKPLQVRVTLSDTGADEALTITLDHATDSKYDYILDDDLNLNGILAGFVELSAEAHYLGKNDGLVFNFANSNNRTIGLEIISEVLL